MGSADIRKRFRGRGQSARPSPSRLPIRTSSPPAGRTGVGAWIGGLTLGLLLATVVPAGAGSETDALRVLGLQGSKEQVEAPDFSLPDLGGRRVQLKALRGKVVFLNFFATWCGPCRLEMPRMERLSRAYAEKGLVILAVDLREGVEAVRAFAQELQLTFPTLLDADGAVGLLYAARGLPATYLVGRDGRLLWRAFGPREWDSPESRAYFARLLEGRKH